MTIIRELFAFTGLRPAEGLKRDAAQELAREMKAEALRIQDS